MMSSVQDKFGTILSGQTMGDMGSTTVNPWLPLGLSQTTAKPSLTWPWDREGSTSDAGLLGVGRVGVSEAGTVVLVKRS